MCKSNKNNSNFYKRKLKVVKIKYMTQGCGLKATALTLGCSEVVNESMKVDVFEFFHDM